MDAWAVSCSDRTLNDGTKVPFCPEVVRVTILLLDAMTSSFLHRFVLAMIVGSATVGAWAGEQRPAFRTGVELVSLSVTVSGRLVVTMTHSVMLPAVAADGAGSV